MWRISSFVSDGIGSGFRIGLRRRNGGCLAVMIPFPDKINIGSLIGGLLHLSDHIKACVHGLLYFKDMLFVLSFCLDAFWFITDHPDLRQIVGFALVRGFAICGAVVFGVGVLLFVERLLFGAAVVFLWSCHYFASYCCFCGAATILYGFVVFVWITFGGRTVCCRFFVFLRGFAVALPFDGGGVWVAAGRW